MFSGMYVGAVAAAMLVTGAGSAYGAGTETTDRSGTDGVHASPAADSERGYVMRTDARFAPPGALAPSAALTYDPELVPAGAWIEVAQSSAANGATTVKLRVRGMKPGHDYGVHVHRKPCGTDPTAAGGHYQHVPSDNPADANPDNEVWLDFTADRSGSGEARAHHAWNFRRGEASSVIVHSQPGNHGTRVGCFTVPFGWTAGTA
ncbi:superoxide dismutase family protein [Streptomyces sp. NPDC093252]|uniref:superoxide dismutase family protein n=1 Tax=Streptomyces sp. NPDC093252 TaxID=3154980 RepID=UPI00343FA05A